MNEAAHLQRREVVYQGRVQGVGFRYTTARLALGYRVTGYVRNLDDGRVRLVGEGEEAELDRFLAAISDEMRDYIKHCQVISTPPTGEFIDFHIKH